MARTEQSLDPSSVVEATVEQLAASAQSFAEMLARRDQNPNPSDAEIVFDIHFVLHETLKSGGVPEALLTEAWSPTPGFQIGAWRQHLKRFGANLRGWNPAAYGVYDVTNRHAADTFSLKIPAIRSYLFDRITAARAAPPPALQTQTQTQAAGASRGAS